jgi:hypothetical protein
MSPSVTMPARFVGDTPDLNIRRRFRRLPAAVQRELQGSSGICHKRLSHVEHALIHFGQAATLSWLGNGLPLRAVDGRRS